MKVSWPSGHKFAFTVFDDTDWATVEKVKPAYDLLADLGMRTTKSVWLFSGDGGSKNGGSTCEDDNYLRWIRNLQKRGVEIGLHNAAPVTSNRQRVQQALDRFSDLFGGQMLIHCNHARCLESIYWGDARLSAWRRDLYNFVTRDRNRQVFRGHVEGDSLFWGDLCQERVRYVRNFVFSDPNTLAICPEMPYHDPARPFVNFWFASADGGNRRSFLRNFSFRSLDRLMETGGLCIAYVHFAGGFVRDGVVDPEVRKRLEYIAAKDGWFASVSEVLDYLRGGGSREDRTILPARLRRLESRWIADRLLHAVRPDPKPA